jgi:hypothetical protein
VFRAPDGWERADVDAAAHRALHAVEAVACADDMSYAGLYPLSLSARTQVLAGRLDSGEVIEYFRDLHRAAPGHGAAVPPHGAQRQAQHGPQEPPVRRGSRACPDPEHRAAAEAVRLDQTLQSRVLDDGLDLVEAVVSLMPPAWENDRTLPAAVRDINARGTGVGERRPARPTRRDPHGQRGRPAFGVRRIPRRAPADRGRRAARRIRPRLAMPVRSCHLGAASRSARSSGSSGRTSTRPGSTSRRRCLPHSRPTPGNNCGFR